MSMAGKWKRVHKWPFARLKLDESFSVVGFIAGRAAAASAHRYGRRNGLKYSGGYDKENDTWIIWRVG
jgi:hypothetical protein